MARQVRAVRCTAGPGTQGTCLRGTDRRYGISKLREPSAHRYGSSGGGTVAPWHGATPERLELARIVSVGLQQVAGITKSPPTNSGWLSLSAFDQTKERKVLKVIMSTQEYIKKLASDFTLEKGDQLY